MGSASRIRRGHRHPVLALGRVRRGRHRERHARRRRQPVRRDGPPHAGRRDPEPGRRGRRDRDARPGGRRHDEVKRHRRLLRRVVRRRHERLSGRQPPGQVLRAERPATVDRRRGVEQARAPGGRLRAEPVLNPPAALDLGWRTNVRRSCRPSSVADDVALVGVRARRVDRRASRPGCRYARAHYACGNCGVEHEEAGAAHRRIQAQ